MVAHGNTVVAVACRRHGHAGRAATWRGQDGIGREGDGICDEKRRGLSVTARCSARWNTAWRIGLEQRPVTRPWTRRGAEADTRWWTEDGEGCYKACCIPAK